MANDRFCEKCEQEFRQGRRGLKERRAPLFGWNDKDAPNYHQKRCWKHWAPDANKMHSYQHYVVDRKNRLQKAHLEHVIFDRVGVERKSINLRRANLEEAQLEGAQLKEANLKGTNLKGANLHWAKLQEANLKGADLSRVDLYHTHLFDIEWTRYTLWVMLGDGCLWFREKLRKHDWGKHCLHRMRRCYCGRRLICYLLRSTHRIARLAEKKSNNVHEEKLKRPQLLKEPAVAFLLTFRSLMSNRSRIDVTRWSSVAGMDTAKVDSVMRRQIKDAAYVEDIHKHRPSWARFWRRSCFYGQSFGLWAVWCFAFAFVFACLYDWCDCLTDKDGANIECFGQNLYFSIVAFTTLGFGDIFPKAGFGQFSACLEVILGYIGLGGLISILANKVARRA